MHTSLTELAAWLRLSLTPGVGNATARRLLVRFGAPEHIFSQSAAQLETCASAKQVQALLTHPPDWETQHVRLLQWLQTSSTQHNALIPLGDPRYPPALLQIEDPPLMLYAMGPARWLDTEQPLLDTPRALAMVGSRNPTAQGIANARQFAQHLCQQQWCVVSGMALGIDAAAHEGALASMAQATLASGTQPPTVAVVGTGIDRIYPRQNAALAREIAQHGVIVSEYPLGTPPVAANFPKRNRLIAGMSAGTLVVEAALASGSLVTARLASEQGREVFAIPGSIHTPQSKGCHALLRQGAKLVETVQDIWDELPMSASGREMVSASPMPSSSPSAAASATPTPDNQEHPLFQALGFDPQSLDMLQARSGWETAALQAWLLEQELEGHVARLPGGWFQRVVQG